MENDNCVFFVKIHVSDESDKLDSISVEEDVQGKIFFTHQLDDSGSSDTLSIHQEFTGNIPLSSHEKKHRTSILDDFKLFPNESTRKTLVRAILILTCMFIVLSGILLIVTLNMSEEIDDKVRQSNVLLREKTVTKTAMHTPMLVEISNSTEP
ncbi:unnamed protein product [Mytilus edulis]|uniref:Uncharacterized protein n=1 Tax=Mytilus edulis TaxID=6550 RepID=A0A8S3QP99_MYTED|nr:unnamed protein product [Mytilus edulis]